MINHLHVVVRERWCYSFRLKPWSSIVNMWIYFSGCYQGMLMCVINSLTTNVKLMGFYFFYPNKASFYTNLFMFWIPSSIPFYIFKNECFSLFLDIWLVFVFQVYFTFLTNLFIFVQFVRKFCHAIKSKTVSLHFLKTQHTGKKTCMSRGLIARGHYYLCLFTCFWGNTPDRT